jgi:hypothetical protein
MPLSILEGDFKSYWKKDWAVDTVLEGVPTAWVWPAVWLPIVLFNVMRGARRVRGFERDVSMPVG